MDLSFKKYLQDMSETLPMDASISQSVAEKKASSLLLVLAKITEARHLLSEDKVRATSLQTAVFAEVMSEQTSKTVTENKTKTEADPRYVSAREDLERLENDLAYLKAYYEIFLNSHMFYRQVSRGEAF